jgi:hypothetical protein
MRAWPDSEWGEVWGLPKAGGVPRKAGGGGQFADVQRNAQGAAP